MQEMSLWQTRGILTLFLICRNHILWIFNDRCKYVLCVNGKMSPDHFSSMKFTSRPFHRFNSHPAHPFSVPHHTKILTLISIVPLGRKLWHKSKHNTRNWIGHQWIAKYCAFASCFVNCCSQWQPICNSCFSLAGFISLKFHQATQPKNLALCQQPNLCRDGSAVKN